MKALFRTLMIICFAILLFNKSYSQQPSLIKYFCTSTLINKSLNQGVAAYLGSIMMQINHNNWSGIIPLINGIETNTITQQRLLYYIYRTSSNKDDLSFRLYALCGDHDLANKVASYCYKTFVKTPKSASDLKVIFDKIDKANDLIAQKKLKEQEIEYRPFPTQYLRERHDDSVTSLHIPNHAAFSMWFFLDFVDAKKQSIQEINDYLFNNSKVIWDLKKSGDTIILKTSILAESKLKYYPDSSSLLIETTDSYLYNAFYDNLMVDHYSMTKYATKDGFNYKTLFENNGYKIYCTFYPYDNKNRQLSILIIKKS